jgi:hypothetical protein
MYYAILPSKSYAISSIIISMLSFFILYSIVEIGGYNDIESILLILCSTIIGCTFWIVETMKSAKSDYKPLDISDFITTFFKSDQR